MLDGLFQLRHRINSALPSMPTRDELLAEAQDMFATTKSLDESVDRANDFSPPNLWGAIFW